MVTSLKITEDAVEFSNEGELVGKLYKRQMDPQNIAAFAKANYNLQGTVKYDAWVAGAFAGLSLLLGEHMIGPEDLELTGDGSGEAAPELLPGEIVVPGQTVIDGITVGTAANGEHGGLTPSRSPENETIVPSAESSADAGETIVPVPESPAAVASPEASGTALP